MKKFIEILRRDDDICGGDGCQHDIIRTEDIVNIYIEQPEAKNIVIERLNHKGKVLKYVEQYDEPFLCRSRYNQLLGILNVEENNRIGWQVKHPSRTGSDGDG